MLVLTVWAGGMGPALATAAARDAAEPCCPEEADDIPCSPFCTECACLPLARSLLAPTAHVARPVLVARSRAPTPFAVESPAETPRDDVFHPPRA